LLPLAGNDQCSLRQQRDAGKHLGELVRVAPVDGRLLSVEQTGLRQQEDA
jgi:hypothetical protein